MIRYDAIIVGSGLGGLASAIILGKEGWKVLILEKNNQFGGNLQTFARNKTIFDTGVHYIGGLDEGQNLNRYFRYFGIYDQLELHRMDTEGFDRITFDQDPNEYPYASGYENFYTGLLRYFPNEETAIRIYCKRLQEICRSFPLYNLEAEGAYDTAILSENTKDFLDSITSDEKLKSVLAGSSYLYAGIAARTPLYVHALSVNSYIESSWRLVKGGSQITKALLKELKKYDVTVLKHQEVTEIMVSDEEVRGVRTNSGQEFYGETVLSNIDLKTTLKLAGESNFRKSYVNRIKGLEPVVSVFSLYIVFKPETFEYLNYNYYHFREPGCEWNAQDYTEDSWPESYMVSMGLKDTESKWAESMTIMTYMRYEEVKVWEETVNTVVNRDHRGESYEAFKNDRVERLLAEVGKKFPDIRQCIEAVYASTPLSYRDYIGGEAGNMYGYVKDSSNPMLTFISPRSKIKNLYFTGQSVNLHGILGVSIGAVNTCSEIVGRKYLIDKINRELEDSSRI